MIFDYHSHFHTLPDINLHTLTFMNRFSSTFTLSYWCLEVSRRTMIANMQWQVCVCVYWIHQTMKIHFLNLFSAIYVNDLIQHKQGTGTSMCEIDRYFSYSLASLATLLMHRNQIRAVRMSTAQHKHAESALIVSKQLRFPICSELWTYWQTYIKSWQRSSSVYRDS